MGSNEYQKAIDFLEKGCVCGCSSRIPKEGFAELRESFQALTKLEHDMFLMWSINIKLKQITNNLMIIIYF